MLILLDAGVSNFRVDCIQSQENLSKNLVIIGKIPYFVSN